ncbi:MAG TPA: hypothetical protein VIR81_08040 [Myxococcales bacterium]
MRLKRAVLHDRVVDDMEGLLNEGMSQRLLTIEDRSQHGCSASHNCSPLFIDDKGRRMTTSLVNASKHDGVMVLELSNPPANTYSYEMMRELDAHVLEARFDAAVHAIVITGAGGASSAGDGRSPKGGA